MLERRRHLLVGEETAHFATWNSKITGLRWRSEAKPFENQARDGARRSEAKSSVGEEIEAPVGTWGLN